ncbi:MAG: hypothetical protein DI629_05120 [Mesorhizobium amorphae]|nr:MAG: hypothetical protein DI629_05120 [Mesorhizobium amorphae]
MRFVAIFEDGVDPADHPAALNQAHFRYLADHADRIVLCGGLRPDQGQPFLGALWIIEAPDREAATALVKADPYSLAGLWTHVRVMAWGKAPHLGAVTL